MKPVQPARQVDSRDLAIGVLSITGVILVVGLAIVYTRPAPALADGMTVSRGDFIMTVGSSTQVDEELVYLIDIPEEKMIVYRFDASRQRIEIVQGVDLGAMRKSPQPRQP